MWGKSEKSEIIAMLITCVGINMTAGLFCLFVCLLQKRRSLHTKLISKAIIEVMKSSLKNWEWSTLLHSYFPMHDTPWLTAVKNYQFPLGIFTFLNHSLWYYDPIRGFCLFVVLFCFLIFSYFFNSFKGRNFFFLIVPNRKRKVNSERKVKNSLQHSWNEMRWLWF